MIVIIILSIAGIAYCTIYLAYCIKRAQIKDAAGAALLCLLTSAALVFCMLK